MTSSTSFRGKTPCLDVPDLRLSSEAKAASGAEAVLRFSLISCPCPRWPEPCASAQGSVEGLIRRCLQLSVLLPPSGHIPAPAGQPVSSGILRVWINARAHGRLYTGALTKIPILGLRHPELLLELFDARFCVRGLER